MFGRPVLCFWRLFGLLAMIVCVANIIVLLNGNYAPKVLQPELEYNMLNAKLLLNSSIFDAAETVKKDMLLIKNNLSKISVKYPLWPSVVKMDNFVNGKNVLALGKKRDDKAAETVKKDMLLIKNNLSKISVKYPLWPSVVKMDNFVNGKNVLALGKKRDDKGYLVLGIPTVYRRKAYYVIDTVKWLVTNLEPHEKSQVVIVVFVADFDTSYREKVVSDLRKTFPSAVTDGLIQVVYAPIEYYPNLNNLPLLYGDKASRVQWRSKQSLDYSFLYYYCANLSKYYIQLEDDVLTEAKYFSSIKKHLDRRANQQWSTIEFGARGFIGMTYRSENLPSLAKFARFYFWTMPIDWIFRVYNDIFLYGNNKKDIYKPTIFKHIGEFSSLDGQVRRLEDITATGKKDSIKHIYQAKVGNPKASITTTISQHVEKCSIDKAYGKSGYFWGRNVNEGHYIEIALNKSIQISRLIIPSGSPVYPSDALLDTTLMISEKPYEGRCIDLQEVARFVNAPTIDHRFNKKVKVSCLRLTLDKIRLDSYGHKRWLIIREIALL